MRQGPMLVGTATTWCRHHILHATWSLPILRSYEGWASVVCDVCIKVSDDFIMIFCNYYEAENVLWWWIYCCAQVLHISDFLDVYHSRTVMFNLERGDFATLCSCYWIIIGKVVSFYIVKEVFNLKGVACREICLKFM